MKLDVNYNIESTNEALENIKIMKNRKKLLLEVLLQLDEKIEQYENHIVALDKFHRSTEKEWIDKGEEPSPHYLNEK